MFEIELEEQPDVSKNSSLWVEKYRPSNLDEFVGNEEVIASAKHWIAQKEITQLFLHGSPGTGKTSLAKLLIKNIPCDSLIVNASDENGVDTMRNKIQDFAMTMGINPLKIIVLDEADRISASGQDSLKGIIEQYQSSTRFILTCNYQEKVIDAIKSRCQSFEIKPMDKVAIMKHLIKILTTEKITFKNEDVAFIVKSYFPDLRKTINVAQQFSISGELKLSKVGTADQDYRVKLVELLKGAATDTNTFKNVRQLIADAMFSDYDAIYKHLFDNVDSYAKESVADVILILAESVYQSSLVFEKEITMVATLHKIIELLRK